MPFDYPLAGKRIWLAGHTGMLGAALLDALERAGAKPVLATRKELDLTDQAAVRRFVTAQAPDAAIIAAGEVGGVAAYSDRPAYYLSTNLSIAINSIEACARHGVARLLFVGSGAAYPENANQPIEPDALMSGPLDPAHEAYGIAKIAGIRMCQSLRQERQLAYMAVMPCNLYGPNGKDELATGHVIPTLMRRFHEAAQRAAPFVEVWGSGNAQRQFLHVEDAADAILFALKSYDDHKPLNIVGAGEITIAGLAEIVASVTGFEGEIRFDPDKPEGAMRRALCGETLRTLGWKPQIQLAEGLTNMYRTFR